MTGHPENQSAELMRRVLAVAECEGKEKLLNRVHAYQELIEDKSSSSDRDGIKDGPDTAKTFYSDEPPHLMGEGKYPQPLSYIAGGIGT